MLARRSILNYLQVIKDEDRREEEYLWNLYHEKQPGILGALLTVVSNALKNLPTTKLDRLPRMADFAKWVSAAESGLGLKTGAFIEAYATNRNAGNRLALDVDDVGSALTTFMADRDEWGGYVNELLKELSESVSELTLKSIHWPKNPATLRKRLNKLASNFRRDGILIEFGTRDKKGSRVKLAKKPTLPASPTSPSPIDDSKEITDASTGVGKGVGSVGSKIPAPQRTLHQSANVFRSNRCGYGCR